MSEKKTDDDKRLDKWALFISILAFAASGASAWYARTQINLTAGQIKAYVQVSEAKLIEPLADASFVQVQLKLKNSGQTAAINVHGDMDYQEGNPNLNGESNYANILQFGPMGPGFERSVALTSNRRSRRDWPEPSTRGDHAIYFYGTVWYTDNTTGEDGHDDWCYRLVLKTLDDLKKLELEQCTILQFKSKSDPLKESH